jgi:hypothetical protein
MRVSEPAQEIETLLPFCVHICMYVCMYAYMHDMVECMDTCRNDTPV